MFIRLTLFLLFVFVPSMAVGETWGDFESRWIYNATGFNNLPTLDRDDDWSIHPDPHATMNIEKVLYGYNGGYTAKINITAYGEDGTFKVYNQYTLNDCTKMGSEIQATDNEFVWYMVWPSWSAGQVHLGPSNRDPDSCDDPGGFHYYHHFKNVIGSPDYWIQFIADTHPQHSNASGTCGDGIQDDWDCDDPPNEPRNPAGNDWGYMEGWQRVYIQFAFPEWEDETDFNDNYGPYSVYLDQQEFRVNTNPDNTETVNEKVTAYYGNNQFVLHWETDSNYTANSDGTNRWGYEVRYSANPITNSTDYNNATPVDDTSNPYWDNGRSANGEYRANFTIPGVEDYDTIFFALAEIRRNPSDGFDSWEFTVMPFVLDNAGHSQLGGNSELTNLGTGNSSIIFN